MATSAQALAEEIAELRRRLDALERTASADLRSIDDGTLTAFDEDGNPVVEVGLQEDGSYGVQGVNGGKVVADEARQGAITAEAILDGAVGPNQVSFYGEVEQAQADAAAAAQAAAAAESNASAAQTTADEAEAKALEALGAVEGKSEIVFQATAPAGDASVFWVDTDTGRGHRWDGAAWIEIQDEDVQTALSEASAAQSAADAAAAAAAQAQQDADAAATAAATAQSRADAAYALADGKVQTYFGTTDPTTISGQTVGVGDLWFDEGDGNVVKRWSGSAWVTLQDEDVQTALATASAAEAAADGKITTFYGSTAPTAEAVGDLWVDPSRGNLVSRWNGSSWVSLQIGAGAIAPGSITETEIKENSISTPHLKANAIDGMTITGPTIRTSTGAGRMEILDDGDGGAIYGWGFATGQVTPASINPGTWDDLGNLQSELVLRSGSRYDTTSQSTIRLRGGYPHIRLDNDTEIRGDLSLVGLGTLSAGKVYASTLQLDQGRLFRGFDYATTNGVCNNNGEFNISHSLGETPNTVVCTSTNNGVLRHITVVNRTPSYFTVRIRNHDGSLNTGGATIGVAWIALTV